MLPVSSETAEQQSVSDVHPSQHSDGGGMNTDPNTIKPSMNAIWSYPGQACIGDWCCPAM